MEKLAILYYQPLEYLSQKTRLLWNFQTRLKTHTPDYNIDEATGWGGLSLIVINTKKVNGGEGPSFWVDVPSGKFTQLSSHFN